MTTALRLARAAALLLALAPAPARAQREPSGIGRPSAPTLEVEVQDVSVEGPSALGLGAVTRILLAQLPAYRRCFRAALQRDPDDRSGVDVRFTLTPTGGLAGVRAERVEGAGSAVRDCVVRALRAGRFVGAAQGPVTVHYRVVPHLVQAR